MEINSGNTNRKNNSGNKQREVQLGKCELDSTNRKIRFGEYKSGNTIRKIQTGHTNRKEKKVYTNRKIQFETYNLDNSIGNTHRNTKIGKYKQEEYKSENSIRILKR